MTGEPLQLVAWLLLLLLAMDSTSSTTGGGRLGLHILEPARAARHGASCLYGSPGGYSLARAPPGSPNASKFFLFLEGGGWCTTMADCAARAWAAPGVPNGALGSTARAPLSLDPHGSGGAGNLSGNKSLNPTFADWTTVVVNYCDGGSFAGSLDHPVTTQSGEQQLWFRGKHILRAVLEELQALHGLDRATEVVLGGCSAGGLAVYLHCDVVAQLLAPTPLRCFADAGFFPDVVSVDGESLAASQFREAFDFMNASSGVDQSCIAAQATKDNWWKCFFAEHTLPHVSTPLFILNSGYDPVSQLWQYGTLNTTTMPATIGRDASWEPCLSNFSTCNSSQLATVQHYHDLIVKALGPATAASSPHGVFLPSCIAHCQGNYWTSGHTIRGESMASALDRWLLNQAVKMVDAPWSSTRASCAPPVHKVSICGGGEQECVCSDTFDHDAKTFDAELRPRAEVCVDPASGQANGLSVLNGNRTEVLGPAIPRGCSLLFANVSALLLPPGSEPEVTGVTVHREVQCDDGVSGATTRKQQEIRFVVRGNATVIECSDSAAPAQGAATRGDCSPTVQGCCIVPVAQPKSDLVVQ
eukprot:COSAG06_NODE_6585_length_2867_cov_1.705564_2_plen_586_part_00